MAQVGAGSCILFAKVERLGRVRLDLSKKSGRVGEPSPAVVSKDCLYSQPQACFHTFPARRVYPKRAYKPQEGTHHDDKDRNPGTPQRGAR